VLSLQSSTENKKRPKVSFPVLARLISHFTPCRYYISLSKHTSSLKKDTSKAKQLDPVHSSNPFITSFKPYHV